MPSYTLDSFYQNIENRNPDKKIDVFMDLDHHKIFARQEIRRISLTASLLNLGTEKARLMLGLYQDLQIVSLFLMKYVNELSSGNLAKAFDKLNAYGLSAPATTYDMVTATLKGGELIFDSNTPEKKYEESVIRKFLDVKNLASKLAQFNDCEKDQRLMKYDDLFALATYAHLALEAIIPKQLSRMTVLAELDAINAMQDEKQMKFAAFTPRIDAVLNSIVMKRLILLNDLAEPVPAYKNFTNLHAQTITKQIQLYENLQLAMTFLYHFVNDQTNGRIQKSIDSNLSTLKDIPIPKFTIKKEFKSKNDEAYKSINLIIETLAERTQKSKILRLVDIEYLEKILNAAEKTNAVNLETLSVIASMSLMLYKHLGELITQSSKLHKIICATANLQNIEPNKHKNDPVPLSKKNLFSKKESLAENTGACRTQKKRP